VEDAPNFTGNAIKKAVELARWIGSGKIGFAQLPDFVLADDSGLEVDALRGAPGVHSARFAALDKPQSWQMGNSPDAENNAKLLRLLGHVPLAHRKARFRCVIAMTPVEPVAATPASPVCYADESELKTEIFEGACEGHIALVPSGKGGFGYDPLFIPVEHDISFAELGEEEKNKLSHRAKALEKLKSRLRVA
jgi:XTP/dITP diphosphohydrolase